MSREFDQKALWNNAKAEEYYKTHERLFGWRCWFCQINNKEEKCSKCNRLKKDAEI